MSTGLGTVGHSAPCCHSGAQADGGPISFTLGPDSEPLEEKRSWRTAPTLNPWGHATPASSPAVRTQRPVAQGRWEMWRWLGDHCQCQVHLTDQERNVVHRRSLPGPRRLSSARVLSLIPSCPPFRTKTSLPLWRPDSAGPPRRLLSAPHPPSRIHAVVLGPAC